MRHRYARLGLSGLLVLLSASFVPVKAVTLDFDGDGKSDIGFFRPSTATWQIMKSSGGSTSVQFGALGDLAVPGDYDGDGVTDMTVFRPSTATWYIYDTATGPRQLAVFGAVGDLPVPADYDGDGVTDIAVFRPSTATWFISESFGHTVSSAVYGTSTDMPIPADYDADRNNEIAVYRSSNSSWRIAGITNVIFGLTGDYPVPADYDGDGKVDIAVFHPYNGAWNIIKSHDGSNSFYWGSSGDLPVPADYDGDGVTDIAVFRPSTATWYIRGIMPPSVIYGTNGDIPLGIPAAATRIIRLSGNLAFGAVPTGSTSSRTLTIFNDGNSALNITSIGYPNRFSGAWSGSIAGGCSRNVTVIFNPTNTQACGGTVTVNSDATSGSNTTTCSGSGSALAFRPVGWLYFQWPYAYSMNEATWYYFNEPSTQWRVSLPGGVWEYMSQGGTATGWNYYQWPYCYSMAAAGWFWFYADASSPQWCVNLNSAQWSTFGQQVD